MELKNRRRLGLDDRSTVLQPATLKASIVVVTWNNARLIQQCLQSLACGGNSMDAEVVVVDNASIDGTAEVVRAGFPDVRVIQNGRNLGFAAGNNRGILSSHGEYLFLINSDVEVPQGCVDAALTYMERHPDIGVLGPKMLLPDGTIGRSCRHFPTVANWFWRALALDAIFQRSSIFGQYLMTYFSHDEVADVDVLTGWFWVIRREAVAEVGLLDERFFMYGEDLDWCRRFRTAGWRVVFFPEAAAIHHCAGSSSLAPSRFYVEKMRAGLQYCRQHHNRITFAGFWLAAGLHEAVRIAGYGLAYLDRRRRAETKKKLERSWACLQALVSD